MRRRIAEKTDELIHRYALHANGAPVDVSPLYEEFLLVRRSLRDLGVNALTMPPRSGQASCGPIVIMVEERLSRREQDFYFAHEIGHIVCGHIGSLQTIPAGDWWHVRDEREASEVASMILIPRDVIWQGETTEHIAAWCAVSPELVHLYPMRVF